MKQIGYDRPLFVQPFDHRGSFTKTYFSFQGMPRIESGKEQHIQVVELKTIVYRGLLKAMEMGVSRDVVGVLVDTQFGAHILADAKSKGIPSAVCVEKSGQNTFDFEYGARWTDHIRFIDPDIVKVLVRLHPKDDAVVNHTQLTRLKMLSDYIHAANDHYLMFELLVPATTEEDKKAGDRYDTELRPRHMSDAVKMIQDFGIEPDIWKIEGLDKREHAQMISAQVRNTEERKKAACILLGRGSNKEKVHQWIEIAAPVSGFIGFAVGRTNFSEPLKRFLENRKEEDVAIEAIARNFKECVDIWQKAKKAA